METFGIGIAGLGVVGSGVAKNLVKNAELITQRTGFKFEIKAAALRDPALAHGIVDPSKVKLTTNSMELANDPSIHIIVELMGGTDAPRTLIQESLKNGKAVVTANKALLAECGEELTALAAHHRKPFGFEASVAGGIPVLKALREGLVANNILSIHGIVNGTCNYILSQIAQTGSTYGAALAEAQKLGFAEADPTLDVEGFDAMHKTVVLAALAHGFWIPQEMVHVQGISKLASEDFAFAKMLGYTIKLIATVKSHPDGAVEAHVQPTFVPNRHVLASVSSSFNALAIKGDVVGETLFYGRGAGSDPTASAVIADIVDAAAALSGGHAPHLGATHSLYAKIKPYEETMAPYYIRLGALDKPGTLATIAQVFAAHQIGISSVFQPKDHPGDFVPLILLCDTAPERDVRLALAGIAGLGVVNGPATAIRLEEFAP